MTDLAIDAGNGGPSKRSLGSGSAEHDRKFDDHFVSTSEFTRLASDECAVVVGAKGSGKTALMRALATVYKDRFAYVYAVKLDQLKFGPLFNEIKKLDSASDHGIVAISRSMWQNVIAIYFLEAAIEAKLVPSRERTDILKYLRNAGHLGTSPTQKLGGHLERVWRLIAGRSRPEREGHAAATSSLTPIQQDAISAFPGDARMRELLMNVSNRIREGGKPVLLCFDGLDSIIEHSLESRDTLFAGLIDGAYKTVTDQLFSNCLALKVLLPKELAVGARRRLRDLDKEDQFVESIHWTRSHLQEFIARRLDDHLPKKGRPFDEVWREYFPEKIRNDAHGVEEDSFYYVIRHTMFRPRQLLLQVQWLLNKWDARPHAPFRVDPTFFPRAISEGNLKLAEYVVNELRLDFPNLEQFLRSFRGVSSVQQWDEVQIRLQRFLGVSDAALEQSFTDLYNYGLFGIQRESHEPETRRVCRFDFGFMTPNVEPNVTRRLQGKTLVAVSPMLIEYCGCRASLVGAVVPTE